MKKYTQNKKSPESARGGSRPGSGRPKLGHQRANYTLPPELIESLRQAASEDETTASALVAAYVRDGLARRAAG